MTVATSEAMLSFVVSWIPFRKEFSLSFLVGNKQKNRPPDSKVATTTAIKMDDLAGFQVTEKQWDIIHDKNSYGAPWQEANKEKEDNNKKQDSVCEPSTF